ncbi:hypothetical protein PIB30_070149 [Stylosanthes scabra]|uniref:Uncharacterized protein n=1 Tax=Stylosanthes scabra TaxID=79078 RepID=A0ABU6ZM67_9FABA|nr:hypothetical protein [Stylosanthes scabra]
MGKMNKNKKVGGRHGPPGEPNDIQNQEMDIRKIMKEVENFSYSHMTWKERKKIENQKVVSLGGKPPKKQKLPLSVARPTLKKQKEREQKMLQEWKKSRLQSICEKDKMFWRILQSSRGTSKTTTKPSTT